MKRYRNDYRELGQLAQNLIRNKARQALARGGWTVAELDDVEQELAADLFIRMSGYDRGKSSQITFISHVLENCLNKLYKRKIATRRDSRGHLVSLDDETEGCEEDNAPLLERVVDPSAKNSDRIALSLDLQRAVAALTPDLRLLWDGLLRTNICRLAKESGIPRTTLYYRLKHLRRALARFEIHEHLGLSATGEGCKARRADK